MKILFIVPYAPTLIRTRPHNLLRSLVRRGHRVTLATLWETEAERQVLADLSRTGIQVVCERLDRLRIAQNAVGGLPRSAPLQAVYCWEPNLARAISRLVSTLADPFDIVHVEHLRGAEYGRRAYQALRRAGHPTPVVWDSVDCISLLFEQAARYSRSRFGRWMTRFELPRTRRYEGAAVRFFGKVLATSPKDQLALEALAAYGTLPPSNGRPPADAGRVTVLPNGVDVDYFAPNRSAFASGHIVFTGKMSYHANMTAALHLLRDIMPLVWQRLPLAKVVIAGSGPAREIRDEAVRHGPRVTVTGYVPDLRPFLQSAIVAVAPVRYGAGIQNKVLEAMACGVPVVASAQASSALQAQPGRDLLVAETAEGFAAKIVELLEGQSRRTQLGEAGRQYVLRQHQWDQIAADLEQYYCAMLLQANHLAPVNAEGGRS